MARCAGFNDDVARKAKTDLPLSECQEKHNQRIAKKRVKLDQVKGRSALGLRLQAELTRPEGGENH